MKRKWILYALILLFSCVAVYSGIRIYRIYDGYREGETVYSALAQAVTPPDATQYMVPTAVSPTTDMPSLPTEPTLPQRAFPSVDFATLWETNPACIGWIIGEGTAINYPVVQGQDNSYYLNRLFDGTYNSAGCIFLDYQCAPDFSDTCSTIYGHHMKNGSMFSSITEYQTQTYYDAHPELLLLTPSGNYVLEVFSGYITDVDSAAWQRSFDSDDAYAEWLSNTKAKSLFQSNASPTAQDRVITLSTCTYEFQNARFVLVCVLKK